MIRWAGNVGINPVSQAATSSSRKPDRTKQGGSGGSIVLPPLIERELRAALHQHDARKSRFNVARIGVLGVSLFLLFGALTGTRSWGMTLHFYLFLAGLTLTVWPAITNSVGLFAEERRQQTLELLYLTGIGSGDLFVGKLLGGALVSSCEVLALAPCFAPALISCSQIPRL